MATTLAPVDSREVVRCDDCHLVQFKTTNNLCRRCRASLDEDEPEPILTPSMPMVDAEDTSRSDVQVAKAIRGLRQRAGLSNQALLRLPQGPGEPLGMDAERRDAAPALPLQRKATAGSSDDPLEQEADRAADQVLRMPDNPAVSLGASRQISRKCDGGCDEEEGKLQFKRADAAPPPAP